MLLCRAKLPEKITVLDESSRTLHTLHRAVDPLCSKIALAEVTNLIISPLLNPMDKVQPLPNLTFDLC